MLPLIASAAAQVATAAIQADAEVDKQLFSNPAMSGGIQTLGSLTVGNRQVGGTGNAAGATSASPSVSNPQGTSPDSSGMPSASFLATLTPTEKYALIGAGLVAAGLLAYSATRR